MDITYNTESLRDFRPHFYAKSFDSSLTKLKRPNSFFKFLCVKEVPINVKRILGLIESFATHTHYGLFSTNGCLLISEMAAAFLKDEKTVKNHIKETIKYFEENKITFTSKIKKGNEYQTLSVEQPVFDDLRIIKTEKGVALTYSFSCAVSQSLKKDLSEKHFFSLYCRHHKIDPSQLSAKVVTKTSNFLFSLLKVTSLLPNELVKKVFNLSLQNLVLLSNNQTKSLGLDNHELKLIADTKHNNENLDVDSAKDDFTISMESWIDLALSKTSESNFYYFCLSKLINNLRNKFHKKSKTCEFEIRVSTIRNLLQRHSKNYDNTAIKLYLYEVVKTLNEKTDLIIGAKTKPNTRGTNFTFSIFVAKKDSAQLDSIRSKLAEDSRTKVIDYVSVVYQEVTKRRLKTNAFYCLDKAGNLNVVDYVIFDDLIKNPLSNSNTVSQAASAASKAPVASQAGLSSSKHQNNQNTVNQAQSAAKSNDDEVQLPSVSLDVSFDTTSDAFKIKLNASDRLDKNELGLNLKVYDDNMRQIAFDSSSIVASNGDNFVIPRATLFKLVRGKGKVIFLEALYEGSPVAMRRVAIKSLLEKAVFAILRLKYSNIKSTHTFKNLDSRIVSHLIFNEDGVAEINLTTGTDQAFSVSFVGKDAKNKTTMYEVHKRKTENGLKIDIFRLIDALQSIKKHKLEPLVVFKVGGMTLDSSLYPFLLKSMSEKG